MGKYKNPGMFVLRHGAPFLFDYSWEELDELYHGHDLTIDYRPGNDPCQWSDEHKAQVNAEHDEWMRKYEAWLEAD